MRLTLEAIVTGISIGSVYGLIAVGYTVIYNATRVFNLAQGDLVMVGVMVSYVALDSWHWSELGAFLLVLGAVTALSVFEGGVAVLPLLRNAQEGMHRIGWFISTLAFSLVIETVVVILYGPHYPVAIPSPLPNHVISVGSVTVQPRLLATLAALIVILVSTSLFYKRTWYGQAMRAAAQDREAASLRGVSPRQVCLVAFLLGGVVAAVAGYAVAPIVFSDTSIGLEYSLKGFLALAIGGFGSIRGAVVGALLLGVAEQLFDLWVSARFELVAGLGLLMVILLVRPNGLFGEREARVV
jgi:branched-chain amino acid transport system permease protein